MKRHYKIKVSGKVQGVFYRASTKQMADLLGIKGFVRNEPDETVYIEAEGDEEVLVKFIQWCHHGPERAQVTYVSVNEHEPVGWRNVCPAGWHVPSDSDFQVLSDFLGGDDISGTHLKAIKLWGKEDATYADNASGFTAPAAGIRFPRGSFDRAGSDGADFWSSTSYNQGSALCRILYYGGSNFGRHTFFKPGALSVRCVAN